MAYEFYIKVEGDKQKAFKGESTREGHTEEMVGLSFKHEVKRPVDIAKGWYSGARTHAGMIVTKEWGPASPMFLQAMTTGEKLNKVMLSFYRTNNMGVEELYYTIELNDARISNLRWFTGTGGEGSSAMARSGAQTDTMELEEITFSFRRITVTHVVEPVTSTVDDYDVPVTG